MDKTPKIVYFKSAVEPDLEMIDLLKIQAQLVFIENKKDLFVHEPDSITMLFIDIRGEVENGARKIDEVQMLQRYNVLPAAAVCDFNNLNEYTCAMNHNVEIIDVPLHKESLIRRCNRACHMVSIEDEGIRNDKNKTD